MCESPSFEIPPNLKQHFLKTIDGRQIHVAEVGKGHPLVFVHGWPEFWKSWLPVVNLLKSNYRCIMPCLYGFGLSDKPDEIDSRIDADFHASDINFIAKKLCSDRPVLIGHDVGSYVLQSVGHKNPKNYSGLIFFNCPTASVGRDWVNYGHVNEIWYQSFHLTDLAQQLVGFNQHTIRLYIEYFLKHWSYNKSAFDLVLDDWVENFSQPNALIGGFSWYKSNNEKRIKTLQGDVDMPLNKISTPSAILWGKHDPILKSDWGKFVERHFDDVFIEYANNSGHFVHVEQPELAMKFINQNAKKWLI